MTLTFYPLATAHDLRLLLVAAVVLVVVLNVYRRPDQIKRLLGAIAISGGAMALLALAQDLLGNGKIYWLGPTVGDKAHSGTFVTTSPSRLMSKAKKRACPPGAGRRWRKHLPAGRCHPRYGKPENATEV